jgi:hypothetical protein
MGSFRNAKMGSDDPAKKFLIKIPDDKPILLKITLPDYLDQWQEVWPTVVGHDGNLNMRRFVLNEDKSNIASLIQFKKDNNIEDMFSSISNENEKKRLINNWKPNDQNAVIVNVGTERTVVKDGKKKRVIDWSPEANIWQFGYTILTKIKTIDNNPAYIEKVEEQVGDKIKMCDPSKKDEGYFVHEVYALRVTKMKKGGKIDYSIDLDKLVGMRSRDKTANLDEVLKALEEHIKPATEVAVDEFIESINGNSSSGEEAASVDDDDEPAAAPAKTSKKPAVEEEELEIEEGGKEKESEDEVIEEDSDKKDELDDSVIDEIVLEEEEETKPPAKKTGKK